VADIEERLANGVQSLDAFARRTTNSSTPPPASPVSPIEKDNSFLVCQSHHPLGEIGRQGPFTISRWPSKSRPLSTDTMNSLENSLFPGIAVYPRSLRTFAGVRRVLLFVVAVSSTSAARTFMTGRQVCIRPESPGYCVSIRNEEDWPVSDI